MYSTCLAGACWFAIKVITFTHRQLYKRERALQEVLVHDYVQQKAPTIVPHLFSGWECSVKSTSTSKAEQSEHVQSAEHKLARTRRTFPVSHYKPAIYLIMEKYDQSCFDVFMQQNAAIQIQIQASTATAGTTGETKTQTQSRSFLPLDSPVLTLSQLNKLIAICQELDAIGVADFDVHLSQFLMNNKTGKDEHIVLTDFGLAGFKNDSTVHAVAVAKERKKRKPIDEVKQELSESELHEFMHAPLGHTRRILTHIGPIVPSISFTAAWFNVPLGPVKDQAVASQPASLFWKPPCYIVTLTSNKIKYSPRMWIAAPVCHSGPFRTR